MSFIYCHLNFHANLLRTLRFSLNILKAPREFQSYVRVSLSFHVQPYGIALPTLHSGVLETKCCCSKFIFQIMLFSKTVYNTAIYLLFEVDHRLKISVVSFIS